MMMIIMIMVMLLTLVHSCNSSRSSIVNSSDGSGSSLRPHQPPPPPPPPPPQRSFASTTTTASNKHVDDSNYINNGDSDSFGYCRNSDSTPSSYSSSSTPLSSQPIHYQFPISSSDDNHHKYEKRVERSRQIFSDGGTTTTSNNYNDDNIKQFNSARDDLVTRYWSRKIGKVQIQSSIALLGYALGKFMSKVRFVETQIYTAHINPIRALRLSLFFSSIKGKNSNKIERLTFLSSLYVHIEILIVLLILYDKSLIGVGSGVAGHACALFLVISTWFRTPLGELSRAIGLSLIIVLQRTQRIRSNYPTWRYVAASFGFRRNGNRRGGPRPFPPARNPWKYVPRSSRDPDFNMIYALISMALVGSAVGGNMPFIPSWMGALVGASISSLACTWQNSPRGDLARSCAMRVVAACTELWKIQADLQIIPKTTVVSSQIIDKTMIFDRKHRVKDRFLSFASKGYQSASKVAEQIQQQQRNRGGIDNRYNDKDYRNSNSNSNSSATNDNKEDEKSYRRDNRVPAEYDEEDYYRTGDQGGDRRRSSRNEDDYRNPRRYSNSHMESDRSNKFERRRIDPNHEQSLEYSKYDERENRRRNNSSENSGAYLDDEVPKKKKSKGFFFRR